MLILLDKTYVNIPLTLIQFQANINLQFLSSKDDKLSKEFYYLGKINAVGTPIPVIMGNTSKSAMEIRYQLYTPIREDLFNYIIS